MHPWVKGIQFCSNEGPCPLLRGDNNEKVKNTLTKLNIFLLENHWTNFNQTWCKISLCKGDSSLFKWRPRHFPRGDDYEKAKIHWQNIEIFISRTAGPISTKFGTKHPWVKGIQVCSNVEPFTSHKINNEFFLLLISIMIIICVYWFELFSQVSDVAHGPLVNMHNS